MRNKNKSGKEGMEPEPPAINAQEGQGVFSGNLKGEYVIMGTAVALIFSGMSITASVKRNKKDQENDDRFRIGYGVSALYNDGAIHEGR
jgi:hypothetical protein